MSDCPKPSEADVDHLLSRCSFPAAGTRVTCAVSGGADSLALLILASRANLEVTAIHIDHGLRAGSGAEADFVASVAARHGASFRSEQIAVHDGPNLEARARSARYAVLPPDAMTGHTADDRAETMLLNLLRGAGPVGLGSLRRSTRRPILDLRRTETEAVCSAAAVSPFQDPSNADTRFRRNRVRHDLLPMLAEISERDPVPILVRQGDLFADLADLLDDLGEALDVTDVAALRDAPTPVAGQALRRWLADSDGHPPDRATIERVLDVVHLRSRSTEVGAGRRVIRSSGRLSLIGAPAATAPTARRHR